VYTTQLGRLVWLGANAQSVGVASVCGRGLCIDPVGIYIALEHSIPAITCLQACTQLDALGYAEVCQLEPPARAVLCAGEQQAVGWLEITVSDAASIVDVSKPCEYLAVVGT
jgi:hypothetical protein